MVFIELQIFLKTNIAIGYNILLKFITYLFANISNIIVYIEVELCSHLFFLFAPLIILGQEPIVMSLALILFHFSVH